MRKTLNVVAVMLALDALLACDATLPPDMQGGEATSNAGIDPTTQQGTSAGGSGTGPGVGGSDGAEDQSQDDGQTPPDSDGGDDSNESELSDDDSTPGDEQTSDVGTTSDGDTSADEESSGEETTDDDASTTSTACTDEAYANITGCSGRLYAELVIDKGTNVPCVTDDYCGYWECQDEWTQDQEDARAPCYVKYPHCGELWREYWEIAVGGGCQTECAVANSKCVYAHYCAVGGPANADPMETMKCTDEYNTCMASCAPIPPGTHDPGIRRGILRGL